MSDSLQEWECALTAGGASPATVAAYTGAVDRCARHSGVDPVDLTPLAAARWLSRPGLSPNTRNAYYRALARWADWCTQTGRLDAGGLLHGIRRPPPRKVPPSPVTTDELGLLLDACRCQEDTAVVLLAGLMGLRRAEVSAVSGADFDRGLWLLSVVGKGGVAARLEVPPAVRRHVAVMPAGLWFPSPVDPSRPVRPGAVGARMVRIAGRAGLPAARCHRLRHWFATTMVRGGVPLTTVQQLMRHANLQTTAGYVLVLHEERAAAVAGLPWAA